MPAARISLGQFFELGFDRRLRGRFDDSTIVIDDTCVQPCSQLMRDLEQYRQRRWICRRARNIERQRQTLRRKHCRGGHRQRDWMLRVQSLPPLALNAAQARLDRRRIDIGVAPWLRQCLQCQRDLHVEARAQRIECRCLLHQPRHVRRIEVCVDRYRNLLNRRNEARRIDFAQRMAPRGQLHRDQHLGIEAEPVGQAPASGLAVPHREMNRQWQCKPIELRARFERGHAIKRVHAAQLEHDVEQRIFDPSAYRLRFRGSVVARRFAGTQIRLGRKSHRRFDSDRSLVAVASIARGTRARQQRAVNRRDVTIAFSCHLAEPICAPATCRTGKARSARPLRSRAAPR